MTPSATPFSTLFSSYIKAKKIRTTSLALYCDVDRSNMYKLINGKRNPSSYEIVQKISDFMRLTPSERKNLLEAYEITIIGYENYFRRKNVQDFITNFSHRTEDYSDFLHSFETAPICANLADDVSISGKSDLNHTIYSILSLESKKNNGLIKLIIQPDSDNIMEMLAYTGKNKHTLKIEHIICLNNADIIAPDKRDYNLSCLQKIIPMYYSCLCEYTPYCYYDSVSSHNSIFNLLSSLIITSEYALIFSHQLKYGILFTRENMLKKFNSIFNDLKMETTTIVCRIDSIFTQFEYFDSLGIGENTGFSFQREPCLIPIMPLYFPDKYLLKDLPKRDYFVESVKQYIQQKSETLKFQTTNFIFTKNGVLNFLKTGRIFELPDITYNPIEYSDRVLIVRNLLNACQNQKYLMIRSESPIANSNLCMYVTAHSGYLLFSSADGSLVYLNLEEPSLLHAFYDYFKSLDETLFYTTEETLAILKSMLKLNRRSN